MKININLFTSTGNTMWTLDKLRSYFEDSGHEVCVFDSIECVDDWAEDCDMLGFVYPIWGSSIPKPQLDSIEKLADSDDRKVFLFGNAGMDAWDTGVFISKKLKAKGYDVVYAANVILPMNSSFPGLQFIKKRAPEKSALMLEYAEHTIKKAVSDILEEKRYFECKGYLNRIGGTFIRIVYKPFVKAFKRKYYIAQDKCNGCGLCYSICPAGAISMNDNKAVIDTNKCIFCLKCYNFCPQTAVLKGKKSADLDKYPRYRGLDGNFQPIKYR